MNMYKFCQGWDRKPAGWEEETLLKKFTRRSLTKVHLPVRASDVRMQKFIGLLELKLSLV